jgi:hypothetical protein
MSKARDLANAGTALGAVSATELGYVDGVTSAIQTQIDTKLATATAASTYEPGLPSQTGNSGKYLTTDGSAKSWGTVSQYALPSQTGNTGKFLTTNGTAESWGSVATPGNWTKRFDATGTELMAVAFNGTNMYVVAGDAGLLYSSPDGITWTSRTSQFGASAIVDVAFGNGLFVAVGAAGKISTSTDGITWTARTSNMSTNEIKQVVYANSLWVAVGAGGGTTNTGGITYSSDGLTWTRKSQSVTIGAGYNTVHWNGTNWLVGSGISTNNYLYATTPGGTWTAAAHSGGYDIYNILSDGTRTIFVKGDENWYSTTGTTLSSTTGLSDPLRGNNSRNTVASYNGLIYRSRGGYLHITSVNTTAYPTQENFYFLPGTFVNTSGTLSSATGALGVFSTGIIVAGSNGTIHTSF